MQASTREARPSSECESPTARVLEGRVLVAANSERVRDLIATMPRNVPRQVVGGVADLAKALETRSVSALLFDPNGVAASSLRAFIGRADVRCRRCYVASTPTTRSTDLVLSLADHGLAGALLCDCDTDRAAMLRQVMSADVECALPLRLLATIRMRLLMLPQNLRSVLVGVLVSRCRAATSVSTLSRLAGGSPRSVARWLAAAGLASPRAILSTFRLAHHGSDLWGAKVSMSMLARTCGYSGDRTLRAHCERVLGASPRRLRRHRSETEFLDALVRALLRSSVDEQGDEGT